MVENLKDRGVLKIGRELQMNVLVVKANEEPFSKRVENNLDNIRKIVGDENFEVMEYEDYLICYNSKGLINSLSINRYIDGLAVRGTFAITGNNKKEMDFIGLTEEQIEKLTDEFTIEREEGLEL